MSELLDRSSYCYEDEKYFYLYKHVDATDGSLSIIRNGTLKFTKPQNFNDPFDCNQKLLQINLDNINFQNEFN